MKNSIKIFEEVGQGWYLIGIFSGIAGGSLHYAFALHFDFFNFFLGSLLLRIAAFSYWILNYRILKDLSKQHRENSQISLVFFKDHFVVDRNEGSKRIYWKDISAINLLRKYAFGYTIVLLEIQTIDGEIDHFEAFIDDFFYLTTKIAAHFPQVPEDLFEKFIAQRSLAEKRIVIDKIVT